MGGVKVAFSSRRERAFAAASKQASKSATNLDDLAEAGDAARAAAEQKRPSPIRATLIVMGRARRPYAIVESGRFSSSARAEEIPTQARCAGSRWCSGSCP